MKMTHQTIYNAMWGTIHNLENIFYPQHYMFVLRSPFHVVAVEVLKADCSRARSTHAIVPTEDLADKFRSHAKPSATLFVAPEEAIDDSWDKRLVRTLDGFFAKYGVLL